MPESILLVVLTLFFTLGLALAIAGFRRRSWGLLILGAVLTSMPMGFASIVMAAP